MKDIGQQILEMPHQLTITFIACERPEQVSIDIKKDECLNVVFENGFVIVKTEKETKFMCREKDFLCLWN